MSFTAFFVFYLLATSSTQSCLTSAEDYAVEALVPSYEISNLQIIAERTGSLYAMSSQYGNSLIAIFKESDSPKGLAVRLQIPTEIREIKKPHIKFVSTSAKGTLKELKENLFGEWNIDCSNFECVFEKDLVVITSPSKGLASEVSVEINQPLASCSQGCTGICFETSKEIKCINAEMKRDIETILRYSNVSTNLDDLLVSYRMVGTETISIPDIIPLASENNDWKEAMRQELVFLKEEGVISIGRDEIEQIVSLAAEGKAGRNYRIVFDPSTSSWKYANQIRSAHLSDERDCTSYNLSPVKQPEEEVRVFYLVPTIILAAGLVILFILVIIARVVNSSKLGKGKGKI